jgi:hypothetical protein
MARLTSMTNSAELWLAILTSIIPLLDRATFLWMRSQIIKSFKPGKAVIGLSILQTRLESDRSRRAYDDPPLLGSPDTPDNGILPWTNAGFFRSCTLLGDKHILCGLQVPVVLLRILRR